MTTLQTHWYGIDLRWAYVELLSSISRKTYCRHLARDVLHDALLRFAMTTNPAREQQPHAYLSTIVRHLLVDDYRERSRYIPLNTDEQAPSVSQHTLPVPEALSTPSTEHLADIKQRLQALQIIIDRLPSRCRESFWLHRIEGMPQQDIALKLSISVNMVQRHIIRAMVDLMAARDLLG